MGQAPRALVRLLGEANRHGNDPELFAGLVHACRYCGLYEQSIAAHAEARRLDPNVPTSLEQTLLMTGDIERLLAVEPPARPSPAPTTGSGSSAWGWPGVATRRAARCSRCARRRRVFRPFRSWTDYLMAWLDRRPADMLVGLSALSALKIQDDPEAIFQEGWLLCDVGEHEQGLGHLQRAVAKGYFVAPTLSRSPALRRAPERSRLPGAAGGSGSGPPAGAGRVPRRRRRATARPMTSGLALEDEPRLQLEHPRRVDVCERRDRVRRRADAPRTDRTSGSACAVSP